MPGPHYEIEEALQTLNIERAKRFLLAHLSEPKAVVALSRFLSVSPFHLQREFSRLVGLSPAKYLERIRLQRAAHLLVMNKVTVLDVALQVGYAHHETFTRAFKRQFGFPPKRYQNPGLYITTNTCPDRELTTQEFCSWQLSSTRLQQTKHLSLLTARHIGPYASVPAPLWNNLLDRSKQLKLQHGALVGIGLDNPRVTPAHKLRFDAGVIVADASVPDVTKLPARTWAATTYVGPFNQLETAYAEIAKQAHELASATLDEGPVLEVYHADSLDNSESVQFMEILLPVQA